MADVLIKGMKKPQNCFTCPFKFVDANVFVGCRLPNNCPIVEVPTPHGRLIDADKVPYFASAPWKAIATKSEIENMQTVIEASEVKE